MITPSCFSALQRAEIAEIETSPICPLLAGSVSVLFNEPKLLKCSALRATTRRSGVCFSALQRAEIAEIVPQRTMKGSESSFSALQRAEIAEMLYIIPVHSMTNRFQCSSTSRNC